MSVDTKGVVVTPCKDVFLVVELLERAISTLIRPHWQPGRKQELSSGEPRWAYPRTALSAQSELVQIHFTYDGEKRTLWTFFHCDVDNRALGASSISLSMGCWGSSEMLMRTALAALSGLGPTYIDVNDCDSTDMAPSGIEPVSYVQAVEKQWIAPSPSSLQRWVEAFDAGHLVAPTLEASVGLPERLVRELLEQGYAHPQGFVGVFAQRQAGEVPALT